MMGECTAEGSLLIENECKLIFSNHTLFYKQEHCTSQTGMKMNQSKSKKGLKSKHNKK